jgi:hypothetical protein
LVSGRLVVGPGDKANAPPNREKPPLEVELTGTERAGSLVSTNVVYSPLIRVRGEARIAGRDSAGLAVIQIADHGPAGWTATVAGACPLCFGTNRRVGYVPAEVGAAITALSIAAVLTLGALAGTSALAANRHRRRASDQNST